MYHKDDFNILEGSRYLPSSAKGTVWYQNFMMIFSGGERVAVCSKWKNRSEAKEQHGAYAEHFFQSCAAFWRSSYAFPSHLRPCTAGYRLLGASK